MALGKVLDILFNILYLLIVVRTLISWVNPSPYNPIVQFLYKTTEPILYPIRKSFPLHFKIGIDISPLIAILIIFFLKSFVVRTIFDLAYRLR
jgi:YggT family protein